MTDAVDHRQQAPGMPRQRSLRRWVLGFILLLAGLGYFGWYWAKEKRPAWVGRPVGAETIPFRLPPDVTTVAHVPVVRGACTGYNVLLITLDTTRADRLGYYGNTAIHTPVMDELALGGVFFSRAIAPAPTTLPSHSTILTGLWPFHHGARLNGTSFLSDEHITLAHILRDQGYETAAMVSAFVLNSRYGLNRGFDVYDDEVDWEFDVSLHREAERRGDVTTDHALRWLKSRGDSPFFLWVHYYDPHMPYHPPEPFRTEYALTPYAGEIAFVDSQIRRLVDQIEEMQAREKTLIVLIGDHGESLGQHYELSHGILLYEPVLHIPFLMNCPGTIDPGLHISSQVSCVDVFPTVISMLGLDTPDRCDGVDLTQEWDKDRPIYSECLEGFNQFAISPLLAVRDDVHKYIYGPAPELFNLKEDPDEEVDLSVVKPELAQEMKRMLQGVVGEDLAKAMNVEVAEQFGEEERDKLAALGYVSSGVTEMRASASLPDPKSIMPLMNQMAQLVILYDISDRASSIAGLQKLADRHPDMYFLQKQLADFYYRDKQYYMCLAALEKALDIHPDTIVNLLMLARTHAHLHEFDEAAEVYRRAITLMHRKASPLAELGRMLLTQRRFAEASVELDAAFLLEPNDPNIVYPMVVAMHSAGRLGEARRLLEKRLRASPDFVYVRAALADVLAREGLLLEAFQVLDEVIKEQPDQWELLHARAAIIIEHLKENRARVRRAVEDMERVCQATRESNARYLHTLSLAYARQDRFQDALEVARRALKATERSRTEISAEKIQQTIQLLASGQQP